MTEPKIAADLIRERTGMSLLISAPACDNDGAAPRWWNTEGPLTRSSGTSREGLAMKATRVCSVPGCNRPQKQRTYCNAHLQRLERTGSVQADRPLRHAPAAAERDDIEARILAKSVTNETGCIEWTGLMKFGYGRIGWQGKDWMAHRAMWTYLVGPIPTGDAPDGSAWTLDHLCFNRACVNIEHLEVVSRIENTRRAGGLPKANDAHRRAIASRGEPEHGTLPRYRRLKCRCDLCRAANAADRRAARANQRSAK